MEKKSGITAHFSMCKKLCKKVHKEVSNHLEVLQISFEGYFAQKNFIKRHGFVVRL